MEDYNQRQQIQKKSARELIPSSSQAAPETYPGESKDVGLQFVVKPKLRNWYVEAGADSQFYYTSNMTLSENTGAAPDIGTSIWVVQGQVAFGLRDIDVLGIKTNHKVGFRHQTWFYGLGDGRESQLNNFDFDAQTAYYSCRIPFEETWQARFGVDFTQLLTHESAGGTYYQEALPRWGIDKFFSFGDKMLLSLSYDGNYHVSYVDPLPFSDINDRTDQSLTVAFSYQIIPKLIATPYYRFQYTNFDNYHKLTGRDRDDLLNTIGLTVAYYFNDWVSVRSFVSHDWRDSNEPTVADYQKLDAGGGAAFNIVF